MRYCCGRIPVVLLAATLTLAPGCKDRKQTSTPDRIFGQQELLIGLIPEQNIFRQRERYHHLKSYLFQTLGIKVSFTSLSRYGNIIEHFRDEKLDGAFFGSFTYGLARHQIGVEPLVRPVNLDGTSTYHGYLFARKDSGIRKVSDLKGKRFAFVERATMAGYLFPLAYFKEHGISDVHAYIGETFFAGSHDAAILAVLNRDADVGVAKNTIFDAMAQENTRIGKELMVIATSGVVPQNCLAVRKDLDPELKNALKSALLAMDKHEVGQEMLKRFGARGFIETQDGDFTYLYRLASQVGIDFGNYHYENR
jgi:phosphonate transport system substrate-binding protein